MMDIGDWVWMTVLLGGLCAGWATLQVRLATLNTRLKSIELNHLPSLIKRFEGLPCPNHVEELAKHTIRLEVVAESFERIERNLEKIERRLNGTK